MDMEKVIKEYEEYVNSYISLTTNHDYEYEMHKAVLSLLKEQEKQIVKLEYDLAVTQNNLNYYANGND